MFDVLFLSRLGSNNLALMGFIPVRAELTRHLILYRAGEN